MEALGAARTPRIPKLWAPKKYPLLKPKNATLEHRHFVIGNRTSNDPLSIAMFQCNSHFDIWSILPKPQENHIQNTTRQVCSHGLMRWKRPEAEQMPKSWQQQQVVETSED